MKQKRMNLKNAKKIINLQLKIIKLFKKLIFNKQ